MHTWLVVPVILASVSPLLAFEVICEPKNIKMFVGNNTSLRCFWKCESKCAFKKIIWTKDDHILQAHPPHENQNNPTVNSRFQLMYQNTENGNVSLDIENLQNSDAGTYKCTITIDGAFRQGTINLQVSDASQKADINLKDPNKHYDEKHNKNVTEQPDEKHNKNVTEQPDPSQHRQTKHYGLVGIVAVVIVLALVLRKKMFAYLESLCTGDGEESNSSTGSDSTESGLLEKV